jgi:hypothetical protein
MLLGSGTVLADSATTRDALDRLTEILDLRLEDGRLSAESLRPAVLVSATPRDSASQAWYTTRVIELLERNLGAGSLRLCEACMAPRAHVDAGQMTFQTGPVALDEVVRLDDQYRGKAEPARAAIWIDEQRGGVSVRFVDLRTGRVLFAQNVDPSLVEVQNTERMYTLTQELERRARGDSLTQAFVDLVFYPGQHISLDWTDQWGASNKNLSGFTLSVIDPVVGVGAVHYRNVEPLHMTVGAKLIMSVPTAIVRAVGESESDMEVLDPMLTGVGVLRVPFGRSNFGAVLSASTNGQVGVGISLLNISLLPVLP